jgi:N-acetylmuramoyl-L-alanine amidase
MTVKSIPLLLSLFALLGCAAKHEGNPPIPAKKLEPIVSPATPKVKPKVEHAFIVCIDPGHQLHGDSRKEQNAPGSDTKQDKVTSGTEGIVTKIPEYELNLEIALKVKHLLEQKGYHVVMTRSTNQVDLSNIDRAEIANKSHANLFLRIHADGSNSQTIHGVSVLYPSERSPYTASISAPSKKAARTILDTYVKKTKLKSNGVVPRTDLTGFNWSKVPSVLIEMGFMSNPAEDQKMKDPQFQSLMAEGIVEGIDAYFHS